MNTLKILINDRNYNDWTIIETDTNKEMPQNSINVNPLEYKMFSRDIFTLNAETNQPNLISYGIKKIGK